MLAPSELHAKEGPRPEAAADPLESRAPDATAYFLVKRLCDGVAALCLLVLTAPLIGLAMLLVKLTSRGPGLYSQTRLGRRGRPFAIFKIRTMAHKCESLTGARWCTPGDKRVTPVGRWLRAAHIDELPQLWNVLRGEMSLVGPRPERPEFVPQLEQAIARYRERLLVLPGVTGLAQVQLPPDTDLNSVRAKLAYDLHYVRHLGFWLDVRICWATALKMIGVRFRVIRWIFALPRKETIDQEYAQLASPGRLRQSNLCKDQGASVRSQGDSESCLLTPVS
jgi:lipopolysaccharide/colanic/teichoic acid biosynthesis glycosyltransferase